MIMLLPSKKHDLPSLLRKLNGDTFSELLSDMHYAKVKVDVSVFLLGMFDFRCKFRNSRRT